MIDFDCEMYWRRWDHRSRTPILSLTLWLRDQFKGLSARAHEVFSRKDWTSLQCVWDLKDLRQTENKSSFLTYNAVNVLKFVMILYPSLIKRAVTCTLKRFQPLLSEGIFRQSLARSRTPNIFVIQAYSSTDPSLSSLTNTRQIRPFTLSLLQLLILDLRRNCYIHCLTLQRFINANWNEIFIILINNW